MPLLALVKVQGERLKGMAGEGLSTATMELGGLGDKSFPLSV